jgi:hypothetical protein
MFKDADEVEQAERDQDADCARIDAAIDAAQKAIAAIEARQPYPDERREQLSAIRAEQFSPSATCVTTS